MSRVQKTIDLLVKQGKELTEGELANTLGTTRNGARAVISSVRRSGFPIYLNKGGTDSRGRQMASRYRYGQATREMVRAFYAYGAPAA
tara:strand:- start:6765 stop:7028 length:264 start_codon:yes stop_codon:yes gene_type:complete